MSKKADLGLKWQDHRRLLVHVLTEDLRTFSHCWRPQDEKRINIIRETMKRNVGRGGQWEVTERRKRRKEQVKRDGEDVADNRDGAHDDDENAGDFWAGTLSQAEPLEYTDYFIQLLNPPLRRLLVILTSQTWTWSNGAWVLTPVSGIQYSHPGLSTCTDHIFNSNNEGWMLRPGPTTSHLGNLNMPQFPHRSSTGWISWSLHHLTDPMFYKATNLSLLSTRQPYSSGDGWEKKTHISY